MWQVTKALEGDVVQTMLWKLRKLLRTVKQSSFLAQEVKDTNRHEIFQTIMEDPEVEAERLSDQSVPASTLMMEVSTRWLCTLSMIKRALELRGELDGILASAKKEKHRALRLSPLEWSVLEKTVGLLAPFADAVKMLQGGNYVSLSLVWPLTASLRRFLKGWLAADPTTHSLPLWERSLPSAANSLRAALLEELNQEDRFKRPDQLTQIATLLDPR